MRLYAQLDVMWSENPKRIRAGFDGSGLHALCICLAKRANYDGWIDRYTLTALYQAPDELIDRLLALRLLEEDGDRVRPHDWLEENLSSKALKDRRAEGARAANHARWHDGPFGDCQKCNPPAPVDDPDVETQTPRSSETDPEQTLSGSEVSLEREEKQSASDRRRITLEDAAAIIGERAALRPGVANPAACARSVAAAVIRDRYQDAYAWLNDNPDATPDELAEHLEPAERTPKANVLDPLSEAQMALADRSRRQQDGTACPECGDNRVVLGDDGMARRCTNPHHGLEIVKASA